ncbi:MAG: GWxTD domain-containing protein [Candidatus Edwardsbacteria bacterium]|nr:GWxTD domain-containing protein [Candidatus Edwardsbacteria bacterium]
MKKIALLLVLLAAAGTGRPWPRQSTGDVAFTVDGAAFSSGNGLAWQELYWSFPANGFAPVETLGQRLSRFRTVIIMADSAGVLALNETWNTTAPLPSESELKRKSLIRLDQIAVRSLKPGTYRLSFTITDLVSGRSGTLDAGIDVPAIRADRPAISQIELASEIRADSTEKRFRKGGLRVLPNPDRVFGDGAAYYYFELYGLAEPADKRLKISYNSDNDSIAGIVVNETLNDVKGQAVKTGGFKIDDMPDGGYQLWAQILDDRGRPLASSSAPFIIRRSPMAAMPGADKILEQQESLLRQGGDYYDRIEYIAGGRALETYKKLDSLGRREFLRQFWKARDPDPKTPENEALREHVRRYEYVDAEFSQHVTKGQQGSQTDRGRIYIKYGEPEEIEAKPMQMHAKPVLIWRYSGSRKFIFVDVSGFGRYQLIYTNAAGERKDPNWQKILSSDLIESEGLVN